jgi:hypothetical protein
MGYNRSGDVRKRRLKRAKKEAERLARKAGTETAEKKPAPQA